MFDAEISTLREVDQKYVGRFEMLRWRMMEKVSWTDRVKNDKASHRAKVEGNIPHTTKRRKSNWIGHILHRNCLLKHAFDGKLEGRIEIRGKRGRRRKQLLDDLKEKTGSCALKEEALDGTVRRTRFGKGRGPVVRQAKN